MASVLQATLLSSSPSFDSRNFPFNPGHHRFQLKTEKEMVKNRRITMQKKWYGSVRPIFMHADRTDLILMIVGFIGAVGDGFAIPVVLYVSSNLMNSVGAMSASTSQSINTNTLVLLYVACGQWLACFLEGYCWTRTAGRQASRLRIRYLKAVLRQDVGYFDLHRTSTIDVITSVSSDSLVIQDVIAEKVPNLLMNTATFVVAYIAAFLMFWRLAIVGVPFILLLVVPGLMSGRALMGIARRMKDEYNKASTIAEQALSSIRTVYSFVGEKRMVDEFSAALRGSVNLGIRQGLIKGLATSKNAVVFAKWSFMSYYATRLVINHGAQGGTIFQVICVMAGGGFALGVGIYNLRYFSEAFAAGERIVEVMERVPHIDSDNMEGQILQSMYGEIEFKHVEFFYPSRPGNIILRNFNLKIPASKNVALVGGSGSGKSTVVALLQRFYNSTGGEILLDGVAIDKLQLKWLRSQMGLVSQEPALFATTIKENILFGKENASMEEVFKAAKASNAHNFICKLPQGYDTQVGERGVQMSGGQKQRIAIARAIIKTPRILLLDEATSALDSESERIVQEAIDKVSIGCTTITIAHRLSTIRKAHVINVLQDGKVVETGSHDELVQYENGLYTSFIRLQQMEKQENAYSTASNQNLDSTSSNGVSNMSDLGLTSRFVPLIPSNSFEVSFLSSFQRLLALNLPEWKHATFACIGAILFGAVQPVYAFIVGSTISIYFLTNQDDIKTNIKAYSLGFLGLSIFALSVNIWQQYWFAVTGERLAQRIRENMLSKILTFEIGWFFQEDNASGSICSRINNDSSSIRSLVGDRFSLVVHAISAVIFASAMGLIIAWRLAVVMIAVQPLIIFSVYARVVLLKRMSNKVIKAQNESSRIAAEAMSNFRTVTAFFSQGRILKLLEKSQEGPNQEIIQQSWFTGLGYGTAHSLITCIWGFELWYGGKLITENQIGVRAFFMTFFALWSTGLVIAEAGSMTTDLTRGFDAVRSILSVLDRCSEIDPQESNGYRPDKIVGHLELCEVDFAYPARPNLMIFECFSINIKAGKAMALIGESGSGKSTIINLIERFYDPLKGIVKLDGRDIKTYHLRSLREFIALVSQEPTLFSGTIRDNIMYGVSDKTNDMEIIKAAEAANAHDFITGLKDGYNTWCGDRGSQLSGGQKQRIAIARAILKAPAVLLLDEATSALDSQAEALVQEALERMMVGRTSVVVAHRLSTIKNCDTISVLDKGKVVEEGTHTSLLAKGPTGIYYSLVSQNSQTPTAALSS